MLYTPAFWYEVCHLYQDPASGAPVRRLTSAAAISHNIYCEQPYTSPDGQRVAIIRSADFNRDYPWVDLYVADLPSSSLALAARGVHCQIVNTAWGEHLFYWKPDGLLYRLSMLTMEETNLLDTSAGKLPPIHSGMSVSPDLRYLAYGTAIPGKDKATFGVARVELGTGTWDMLVEHPHMVNPHTQYEPREGKTVLLQENIQPVTRADGTVLSLGMGANLVMINADGSGYQRLAAGPPDTLGCSGHQCYIPGTNKIAFTVWGREEAETLHGGRVTGNLFVVGPGEKPRLFAAPEHEMFLHISVSRCGRFFVSDVYGALKDPVPLVIGCFASGKYRTLVSDCHGTHGPMQWGHAHAYLTADNKFVIFNSDYQGHGQVYAAGVPEGFLGSLM